MSEKSDNQSNIQKSITLSDNSAAVTLFGSGNSNIRLLEQLLGISINVRGNIVRLTGEKAQVELGDNLIYQLYDLVTNGFPLFANDIEYAARALSNDQNIQLKKVFMDKVFIAANKKTITPKSIAQKAYIEAIRKNDLVFGIGPAGTGKTYLAMAMAVASLMNEEVNRIVLCRPAVEAGEKLGFLPGDLAEKVNPYLRPLYDALHDMLDFSRSEKLLTKGIIEVAPLAFMRGRTLNDSFVILDEAQNTTREQMKMFLTRLGYSSKAVVTGDVTQIDLPDGAASGLVETENILKDIDGISFVYFSQMDVIRHRLVQKIILAYQKVDEANGKRGGRSV